MSIVIILFTTPVTTLPPPPTLLLLLILLLPLLLLLLLLFLLFRILLLASLLLPSIKKLYSFFFLIKNKIKYNDDVELNVLGCRVDILGTNCDQCVCMVHCCFTSTETIRFIRTGSPGRTPGLSQFLNYENFIYIVT